MNKQLLDEFVACRAGLNCDGFCGIFADYDENGLVNIQMDISQNKALPALYHRSRWYITSETGNYYFCGEVVERYSKENNCIIDVKVLSGIYKVDEKSQVDFDKEREAVIITSSGEKLIANILRMNSNKALVQSSMGIPENSKVWLRYKDLAIASLTSLEHNSDDDTFIYNLDFSVETLEKRGRIAELILNDKL